MPVPDVWMRKPGVLRFFNPATMALAASGWSALAQSMRNRQYTLFGSTNGSTWPTMESAVRLTANDISRLTLFDYELGVVEASVDKPDIGIVLEQRRDPVNVPHQQGPFVFRVFLCGGVEGIASDVSSNS